MGEFLRKCKNNITKAIDRTFLNNIANLFLVLTAMLLLISLLIQPTIIIALALLALFAWAFLYC